MKRILVTGANGQLGRSFRQLIDSAQFAQFVEPTFIDIEDLDLTDAGLTEQFFDTVQFDFVINCAAYTNVDLAEVNAESAFKANVIIPEILALQSKKHGFHLIHISTDYVFDGMSSVPYKESDCKNPLNVYGCTKSMGEDRLLRISPDSIVIRTAWLYSQFGKNFFLTMRAKAFENSAVKVVDDQFGSPTQAADLARFILNLVLDNKWHPGIYHFTNEGETSWYGFTREIYRLAGADVSLVMPVSTKEYGAKVRRPVFSVLDKSKIKDIYNLEVPHWNESLEGLMESLDKN